MISVTLDREALKAHGACVDGLALFRGRDRIVIRRWTWRAYLWLERKAPGSAGWLVRRGEIPALLAPSADLRGTNLHRADLRGANLSGARRAETDPEIPGWTVASGLLVRET